MTRTKNKIAWAAGLFEGEGTITLNGAHKSPRLKLSMVDFDIVRRFHRIVRVGNLCIWESKNKKHKRQLCWYTGRKANVIIVLNLLMPYFGIRRLKRAKVVLKRAKRYGYKNSARGYRYGI